MQNTKDNQNDFAIIHIRPGTEGKSQPIATVAVNLVPEDDYAPSPHRFSVALASQHLKKDANWDGEMGRKVARGRAERGKNRIYAHALANGPRRDLIIAAVCRVLEAVEAGEINASRKVTRALEDTITRLHMSKSQHDFNRAVENEANGLSTASSAAE